MKSVEYFGADKLTLPKELSFKLNLDFGKLKGRTIYLNVRNLNAKGSLAITTECQKSYSDTLIWS